jgi:hypothetical protein
MVCSWYRRFWLPCHSDDDRKKDAMKPHLEMEMQTKQQAEAKAITGEKSSGRIVASSAIEFYDEEMKHHPQDEERKPDKITLFRYSCFINIFGTDMRRIDLYHFMLKELQEGGTNLKLTGRCVWHGKG